MSGLLDCAMQLGSSIDNARNVRDALKASPHRVDEDERYEAIEEYIANAISELSGAQGELERLIGHQARIEYASRPRSE